MITLKEDFMMKALFSSEETILRQFLCDVLEIGPAEIRSVRVLNPYLKKRYRRHKQGILDVLLLLNDDRKINIELQVRAQKEWRKRNLYYLAGMYTDDLKAGEKYSKLRRCICISILDFNLTDLPSCHTAYRLRDREGNEFSDQWELHTIELQKTPEEGSRIGEWVALFNAETEEELDMILAGTKSEGIREAVRELRIMNLGKRLRYEYRMWLKAKRDRMAEDDYVRDEGIAIGTSKGIELGMTKGDEARKISVVRNMLAQEMPLAQICQIAECDAEFVEKIRKEER